jgi:hypothetical protein
MPIPNDILKLITENCEEKINNHKRVDGFFTEKAIIENKVRELFKTEGIKVDDIVWIKDVFVLREKIKNLKNMPWVLFYKSFYESCLKIKNKSCKKFINEGKETYNKIVLLKDILDNVDGIVEATENNTTVYLVKIDVNLINCDIKNFTLN